MHRRAFLKNGGLAAGASILAGANAHASSSSKPQQQVAQGIPASQQSVSYWCYNYLPLEQLLPKLKEMGLSAIDLITPSQFDILEEHGFTCSMAYGREKEDITTGFINENLHEQLIQDYSKAIPLIAKRGYKNLICFAGNRRGMNDLDGMRVAAKGIKKLMPIAKDYDITVQLELFNSKVNHPDYMGDSSAWSIALCDMVGSDHFKLLYDIYHMQVQEGNVIQTIRDYHQYFGHYHTAGVPGHHELNEQQELYYPAVMQAIAKTGFKGYVAHEFVPTYDEKLDGLREAIRVCS